MSLQIKSLNCVLGFTQRGLVWLPRSREGDRPQGGATPKGQERGRPCSAAPGHVHLLETPPLPVRGQAARAPLLAGQLWASADLGLQVLCAPHLES